MRPIAKLAAAVGFAALLLGSAIGLVRLAGVDLIGVFRPQDRPQIALNIILPDPRFRTHTFLTADSGYHRIGRKDGLGWSVTPKDGANHLNFGPYTGIIAPGPNIATFRLMVGDNNSDNENVVNLDINDASGNRVLGELPVTRRQFDKPMTYQEFSLPFIAPDHARLEFRTYAYGKAYVNQQQVTVTPYTSSTFIFATADSPYHQIGHKDGLGWAVTPQDHFPDFLNYGPYTRVLAGPSVAAFRLMIDEVTGPDATVLQLDVRDAEKDKLLATMSISRHQFRQPSVYQDFDLSFYAAPRDRLEFRTYYLGSCSVNQQQVAVSSAGQVLMH
jgi:hypothetical protein